MERVRALSPVRNATPLAALGNLLVSAVLAFGSASAYAEDIEIYLGQAVGAASDGNSYSSQLPGSAYLRNFQYNDYVSEVDVGDSSAVVESDLVNNHRVLYEYFTGTWNNIPTFDRLGAQATGTLSSISLNPRDRDTRYGFQFTAVLEVPVDNTYTFYLTSVNGSQLYIDGSRVVDNNGKHSLRERTGSVFLTAGSHNVMVNYFNRDDDGALELEWSSSSMDRQAVEESFGRLPNYNSLSYEYYEGLWSNLPNFDALTPIKTGRVHNFTLAARDQNEKYGFRYRGKINVPVSGTYTLYIGSDDGSQLFIDGSMLVDNNGLHGYRERSASRYLDAGVHDISATFFERNGGDNLTVKWAGPGISKQDVATWLVGGPSDTKVTINNFRYQPAFLFERTADNAAASTALDIGAESLAEYWELHQVGKTESGVTIVTIEAADSRRKLRGVSSGVSADNGPDSAEYHWEMRMQSDGSYVFVNRDSNYFLDGWNYIVQTYPTGGYSEQKWLLTPAKVNDTPNLVSHPGIRDWNIESVSVNADGNQIVRLQSKLTGRYVAADNTANGNNAYPQVGTNGDELWEMIAVDTNKYRIKNVNDGRYLHAQGPASNSNVGTVAGSTGNWIHCASENGSCNFTGTKTVRYGANSTFTSGSYTDGVACSNSVFGDPLFGVAKACSYLDNSVSDLNDDAAWKIVPTSVSGVSPPPPDPAQPNILFVLDGSGSMDATDSGEVGTRMQRMQEAFGLVMDNVTNVNVGLMRFSHSNNGGRIVFPVAPIDAARNDLAATANAMQASGATPSVGALYEAARYFRGENVEFGKRRTIVGNNYNAHLSRVSHPDSYTGGSVYRAANCTDDNLSAAECADERIDGSPVYKSPVVSECQANYVVMLTDGTPVTQAATEAQSLTGGSCGPASATDGVCGEELAEFMYKKDQSITFDGLNNIVTHTIGFNFTTQWLKDVAKSGGGNFYTADSALDLLTAIEAIVLQANEKENTIVTPAATLDQTSRLSHRDDIYFALFEPSYSPAWRGNLKRYFFDGSIKDSSSPPKAAIDPDTGSFFDSAQSYWSGSPDGAVVGAGGAASQLDGDSRRVTTFFPGNSSSLLDYQNQLNTTNIQADDLGLPDDALGLTSADRDRLVDWAGGIDVQDFDEDGDTTDTRHYLGDPLHSSPVLITYDWNGSVADSVIFFGTNEGYLHAIDTATGREIYSYVPEALLTNLKHRYANKSGNPKVYGMDGPLTLWAHDANGDRAIGSVGDHAYLYAGMRRGGRNYYALDVTNRNDPSHKWFIEGGAGEFAELGQTWSKPERSRIIDPATGKETDVLIFAGGYDPQQDNVSVRTADTMGRSIFIVDAETRNVIWRGGFDLASDEIFSDMVYSIPSDISVIDLNNDGLVDQMYVGDMGGQVWRFDVDNNAAYTSELVSGGVIAELADSTPSGNRRFYNAPDVSVIRKDNKQVLVLSIGSGYRAHPLNNTIVDRFYVLQQEDYRDGAPLGYGIDTGGGNFRAMKESDLFDVTDNTIGQGTGSDQLEARDKLNAATGWYLTLPTTGEKSLSSSITVNSQVIFTTYIPVKGSNPCSPDIGIGRVYVLNILDGTPTLNLSEINGGPNDPLTVEDRSQDLRRAGIPPKPRVLFPDNGDAPTLLIGPEEGPDIDLGRLAKRVSWVEVPDF